ncbi:hypothetical protein QBC34DRAFT_417782 [Podospora aff. communis PSN243]|uniref:Uncharacterized protein n=1 Tax=Podospora aff. communis PSN243 TaxID=3040156 RepID=A0AAV9G1P7_9PEZI|nr:hypothetical protein QBC34DRAFT_417782 [Podospora aff. communis PSN243]
MEAAIAVGSLRVAYHFVIFGIKVDQVPAAVRRCIELVRTCHFDLEDLIKLRNEALPMLESKPAILTRVNAIIENARAGLLEVARLVDKLRPEIHGGNTPLRGRLEWLLVDSREFDSQQPLISRQHSSVIAELNFLRQLVLFAPLIDGAKAGGSAAAGPRPMVAWENVALLDEMLGGRKQAPRPISEVNTAPAASTSSVSPPPAIETRSTNESPPQYASLSLPTTLPHVVSSLTQPASRPFIYNAHVPDTQGTGAPANQPAAELQPTSVTPSVPARYSELKQQFQQDTVSSKEPFQSSRPRTSSTMTTFDNSGVAFLFGDLKVSSQATTGQIYDPVQRAVPDIYRPTTSHAATSGPLASGSTTQDLPHDARPTFQPLASQPLIRNWEPIKQRNWWDADSPPSALKLPGTLYLGGNSSTPNLQLKPEPLAPTEPKLRLSQTFSSEIEVVPSAVPAPRTLQPQVSALSLNQQAGTKPLSTIPQELIHLQDGTERPMSSSAALPAASTAVPTGPYLSQLPPWRHSITPKSSGYFPYATNNAAASMSTVSLASITSAPPPLPPKDPEAPASRSSVSFHGLGADLPKDNPLFWTTAEAMTPKPPPKEPLPSNVPTAPLPSNASELLGDIPSRDSVPTYATVREHWQPEYLAATYGSSSAGRQRSQSYTGWETLRTERDIAASQAPQAAELYAGSPVRKSRVDVSELPIAPFSPGPGELE